MVCASNCWVISAGPDPKHVWAQAFHPMCGLEMRQTSAGFAVFPNEGVFLQENVILFKWY